MVQPCKDQMNDPKRKLVMVTDIAEIRTHVKMSDNLAELINVLTMYCRGYIVTLGRSSPETKPARVLQKLWETGTPHLPQVNSYTAFATFVTRE